MMALVSTTASTHRAPSGRDATKVLLELVPGNAVLAHAQLEPAPRGPHRRRLDLAPLRDLERQLHPVVAGELVAERTEGPDDADAHTHLLADALARGRSSAPDGASGEAGAYRAFAASFRSASVTV